MLKKQFGNTNLQVSLLGFGAMHLNDQRVSDEDAGRMLNQVLDLGINLIDTARGYGLSEERIGKYISHRRNEFVLSTKVGYSVEGHHDWTYSCIIAGVDEALRRMRTDHIDIVHLHSCPIETLRHGEVTAALLETVKQGKVRVAAYSGENEALDFAIASNQFGGVQTSISICDQHSIGRLVTTTEKGIGAIAKRPIAGAIWKSAHRPDGHAESAYWDRWKTMHIDNQGMDWTELALRFTAYQQGLASSIVGTNKIENFKQNIAYIEKGALPDALVHNIREAYRRNDHGWVGMI